MTVRSRYESKTIGRIFIALIMVILLISLATPASAVAIGKNSKTIENCKVVCTKYVKTTDNTYENTRFIPIYSFIMGGVSKKLYVQYTQVCEDGHYSRTCTPFTRCSVNQLCEQSGPDYTEPKGQWETCSRWKITNVWVV